MTLAGPKVLLAQESWFDYPGTDVLNGSRVSATRSTP